MKTIMLRIRVEPELKDKLQNAVRNGLAQSMSDLIRDSVSSLLETRSKAAGTPGQLNPATLRAIHFFGGEIRPYESSKQHSR
jgi:Arc/MetJ-type ribon-helix-helix transcriptional regulator